MSNTWNITFKVVKPLPVKQLQKWEDKVVYGMARATLDFTNKNAFPEKTGTLRRASMAAGVKTVGRMTYGLGYSEEYDGESVDYGKIVYKYGPGTHWTNKSTVPHWYDGVFKKHKSNIMQDALNIAKSELK